MSNIRADKQGSIWRRWDLHLHTPSSYDYGNKRVLNESIISALKATGISAAAVTDHHIMNVALISELQRLASDDLTIFPGIELRSELGGSQSVHYTGIFPESVDLHQLWHTLSAEMKLTEGDIGEKSPDQIYVRFIEGAKAIHEHGGLVIVHAGTKTNSIENISNATLFKQAVKTDLLADHVDIIEVGRYADIDDYRSIVFKGIGFELPIITCSDNHDANAHVMRCPCWIKADATFLGLKQTLIEPSERVYIGDMPPALSFVESNPTKFIDNLELRKKDPSPLHEKWFDHSIPLNHGLVAIIGNKGSGKSALADVIGLLGDCSTEKDFSFLTGNKFRDPRNNKAQEFWARLAWHSGTSSPQTRLSDNVADGALESVKYIPQFYLEKVCTDYESGNNTRFDDELKGVIFSHVPVPERLGKATLDELLDYKTELGKHPISSLRKELKFINQKIVELERRLGPKNRLSLEQQRDERVRALEAHDKATPQVVPVPAELDKEKTERIRTQQAALEKIEIKLVEVRKDQETLTKKKARIARLIQSATNFKEQYATFSKQWEAEYAALGIALTDVISFAVDTTNIDRLKAEVETKIHECMAALALDNPGSLAFQGHEISEKLVALRNELTAPMKAYESYVASLSDHTTKRQLISGSPDTVGSLEYFKAELAKLDNLASEREELWDERIECVSKLHRHFRDLAGEYRILYKGVQEFIDGHHIAKEKGLTFGVVIRQAEFVDKLLALIDKSRRGNLRGKDEAANKLQTIVDTSDFATSEGVVKYVEDILKLLDIHREHSATVPYDEVLNQIRKGHSLEELYDFVFGLEYLTLEYELAWKNKSLNQLSPGERGTLLLVFYLLIDKGDIPLIIDQPEENLDNQTVYEILVPCIREAKRRRQLVLVTHNPNLAVVCDAEQVIHADIDKKKSCEITYTQGAIENPVVNKLILDVLEGTRPAFDVRDRKYRLKERWEKKLR